MLGSVSGDRGGLCERCSETAEDFIYACHGGCALIPKCEPILRIRIRYRSAPRCRETCSLTSNTHKPEANDLVLSMTRPSRNPVCQLERGHIRCESSQFGRRA